MIMSHLFSEIPDTGMGVGNMGLVLDVSFLYLHLIIRKNGKR